MNKCIIRLIHILFINKEIVKNYDLLVKETQRNNWLLHVNKTSLNKTN